MHRHTLLASTLALLLAGAASFAIAQDAAPAPRATAAAQASPASAPSTTPMHHMAKDRAHHGWRDHGMLHGDMMRGDMGAFSDLRSMERLYQQAGRSKEMASVYNDVLAKTQNPMLRTYVYHQLARLQAQPANLDQAIGTLRKSLDENLANEAKMRAEQEQMRAQWQQKVAAKVAPAAR